MRKFRARETGYLQTINYQQGGYVKKGDLLFEIDPRPFIAALDQAKSQLAEAQCDLARSGARREKGERNCSMAKLFLNRNTLTKHRITKPN